MESLKQFVLNLITVTPGSDFKYYWLLIILIILVTALAVFIKVYIKKHKEDKAFKHLFKRYPARLINFNLLLGFYLFFRYYSVPYLSVRLLLYIIMLWGIYLAYRMINSYHREYHIQKKRHEIQMAEVKYLPKHKQKRRH